MAKNKRHKEEQPETKPKPPKETPMEFIASMAGVFVIGLFIITFNFQNFEIPSESMVNTLLIGDHLVVDRTTGAPPTNWMRPLLPYQQIKRGDIIVFISPIQPGLHVVKRIIGAPGDRIRLQRGQVFLNGQPWPEPQAIQPPPEKYDPYRDDFPSLSPEYDGHVSNEWAVTMKSYVNKDGELVVPPDSYFGMGDNREKSLDSRYWGFIPRENIVGRPMFIYWSFETPQYQYTKTSMGERLGWIARVILRFLPDTRWKRTLKWVH